MKEPRTSGAALTARTRRAPTAAARAGGPSAQAGSADALEIANRLRPVLLRLTRALRGEAHELGVTSTQASLLAAIHRTPGVGLGQLAELEHMQAPTLVVHIDNLEAAGLVERARSDPHDRRRVVLSLTPRGQQMLDVLRERRTAWLAERLSALAPADLAAIAAAIEPLNEVARRTS
jgi:DNA-binding MarR family transcriptional regulator